MLMSPRREGKAMRLDQRLVDAAIAFADRRFPTTDSAGAAAMYTASGEILTSTAIASLNDQVSLCHEVGAMCEAYAKNLKITATACVHRDNTGRFIILSACGVCQERLWYWGGEVEVAVPHEDDPTRWRAVTLKEMNPYYWRKPFMKQT